MAVFLSSALGGAGGALIYRLTVSSRTKKGYALSVIGGAATVKQGYMFEVIEDVGKVYNGALGLIKGATTIASSTAEKIADIAAIAQQIISQYLLGHVMSALNDVAHHREGDVPVMSYIREMCAVLRENCRNLFETALHIAGGVESIAICIRDVANMFLLFLDTLPEMVYERHFQFTLEI